MIIHSAYCKNLNEKLNDLSFHLTGAGLKFFSGVPIIEVDPALLHGLAVLH